ncbi:MAG: glutamate synthase, partial [Deltaproteobacteria bacterium]
GSDCLGTALRQGAKKVYQLEILPEPPVQRPDHTPWPMWPAILRESHAHKEGGERQWAVTTKAFRGDGTSVQKLICAKVEWLKKDDGSMTPREIVGSEFEIDADLVVLAMGFIGPGNQPLIENIDITLDRRGNIAADNTMMTSVPGVFVAGDMTSGQSLIVRAIASGRQAAMGIDSYLTSLRR